jgi:hypothetical protein
MTRSRPRPADSGNASVIAGEAKQSRAAHAEGLDCFVAEFIIGPAKSRTRWLLAMMAVRVGNESP